MPEFYPIKTFNADAVKLEIEDDAEASLHFHGDDGDELYVILPLSALRSLARQIAEQLTSE